LVTKKQAPGGSDDAVQAATRGAQPRRIAAIELVRSLKRTSRHLERTLTEVRRTSFPPAPGPKADSRVRLRMQCALIVSDSEKVRRVLVERLSAAGFYVEWASDGDGARVRAGRSEPDVVVVEHSSNDALKGEVVGALAARDAPHRTIDVTVDRFPGRPSSERRVTIVQLRHAGEPAAAVVAAVAQAISVWR
jgi:CheY-like chemotaxis protein